MEDSVNPARSGAATVPIARYASTVPNGYLTRQACRYEDLFITDSPCSFLPREVGVEPWAVRMPDTDHHRPSTICHGPSNAARLAAVRTPGTTRPQPAAFLANRANPTPMSLPARQAGNVLISQS
jgi:hypothetical protein